MPSFVLFIVNIQVLKLQNKHNTSFKFKYVLERISLIRNEDNEFVDNLFVTW